MLSLISSLFLKLNLNSLVYHRNIFESSSKVFGNLRKIFGHLGNSRMFVNVRLSFATILENLRKIFGKVRKVVGNLLNKPNKSFFFVNSLSARGGDLFARIDGDSLPEFEAVKILKQVLDALKFMHDQGFMHLDLKVRICTRPNWIMSLHEQVGTLCLSFHWKTRTGYYLLARWLETCPQ